MASSDAQRIVSLLPSATEIVCALGLGEQLVGVSHSCDYPPEVNRKPRVSHPRRDFDGLSSGAIDAAVRAALQNHGSVYEIDVARIAELAPDLVITQGICDVCAVPERQVIEALSGLPSSPHILTLDAHDLAAIVSGIRDVGCVTGAEGRAAECIAGIERRIRAVEARARGRPRPRVLALEWLDPPYVPGHWVPEVVARAGGELLAGVAGRPSFRMAWDELHDLGPPPDVLLIMPCGFSLVDARRDADAHRDALRRLSPRSYVVDASAYFSRSGPRVAQGIEIVAAIVHPDCFRDVSLEGRAAIFPGR